MHTLLWYTQWSQSLVADPLAARNAQPSAFVPHFGPVTPEGLPQHQPCGDPRRSPSGCLPCARATVRGNPPATHRLPLLD